MFFYFHKCHSSQKSVAEIFSATFFFEKLIVYIFKIVNYNYNYEVFLS